MTVNCHYRWLALLLVPVTLMSAGCNRNADAAKQKEAPRVTVARPVVQARVDEDDYNGWLVAFETQNVQSRVRGHIKKVHYKEGGEVKKGDVLFELDPAPFEADIKQAEAEAKAFEAQKVAAQKDVARYAALVQTGGATKQQLDKAQADAESYDAQIKAKEAEVERLLLDLKYAKITSDVDGKVSKPALTEGNLVNAGGNDQILATIVKVNPIYVDFNVDERAIQRYQKDGLDGRDGAQPQPKGKRSLREQKVPLSFGLDTEEGFPHPGFLVYADTKYSENTGTVLVRGEAKNPDGKLIPGSRVRVRIPVSEPYQAVVVPDSAVLSDLDQKYLLVLGKENTVLRRDITPGKLLHDGMRVVLPAADEKNAGGSQWLKEWEKAWVITVGLQRARVNYPVDPRDAGGQPIGDIK